MSRRARRLALLALCVMLLGGCMSSPPDSLIRSEPGDSSSLISADARQLSAQALDAVLYYRYQSSAFLAPENRRIEIARNDTPEKALIQALLDGPSPTAAQLSPLFPQGTQVLAVSRQGDTLYITFNEALLARYPDEPADCSREPWRTEAPLRRQLCLDSLIATLTEAGLCAQAQVLVYRENAVSSSLRLQTGYLTLENDETPLQPLTRREETLLTAHNAALSLLTAWLTQDWEALYAYTQAEEARPAAQTAYAAFDQAAVLTGFTVSPGAVSQAGDYAVLCADITLRAQGEDAARTGYPLRLEREGGLWKISYARLLALMGQE